MKKTRFCSLLLTILLLFLTVFPVFAEQFPDPETGEPFSVAAKAAMLVDLNTGKIIYEQNADEKIYPASLTKIMTCLLVLENGNLSDTVTVTADAFHGLDDSSSTAGLVEGESMTVETLLYCMMISSGNEASNVAAEYISGSVDAFVDLMNSRAQELGCTGTHFANPHGLHEQDHYTTARDLMKITMAALKSEMFKTITNTSEYILPANEFADERKLTTTNQLILNNTSNGFYYSKAAGIKTGFTTPAGRCVISTAKDDGMYFLGIVCGADTIIGETGMVEMQSFPECIRLFKYGFESFTYVTAVSPLYPVTQIGIRNSAASEYVALSAQREIRILLPSNYDPDKLKTELLMPEDTVDAPVSEGQVCGEIEVSYDGELLDKTELVAITDVPKSEIAAAASNTSAYMQQNWWKWLVIFIILFIVGFAVYLLIMQLRRSRQRRILIEHHRRAVDELNGKD